jgi:PTH1 family peptidyl-tRNA hydrolase
VGIGRPPAGWDPADYLLSDFTRAEAKEVVDLRALAAEAVEAIVGHGLTAAMNRFNVKPKTSKSSQDSKDRA